jgi:hypothetical protein
MFWDNPPCHALLQYAPQQVWGLVSLIAGSLRILALFINGLWYGTPAIRWVCSMISILIWFMVTSAFVSSPVANMGVVVYGWHMVADMYSAFRSASDFIEAQAQAEVKKLIVAQLANGGTNVHNLIADHR